MKKVKQKPHYSIVQSFGFALRGIYIALKSERNVRLHLLFGVLILFFAQYYGFSVAEWAVLFLTVGFVICCELINTAIEAAVDLDTSVFHPIAKFAKDVAAGAVLVAAITGVAVGGVLFWQPAVLLRIVADMGHNLPAWVLILILSAFWILLPQQAMPRTKRNGRD